jgi:hypothetical protein
MPFGQRGWKCRSPLDVANGIQGDSLRSGCDLRVAALVAGAGCARDREGDHSSHSDGPGHQTQGTRATRHLRQQSIDQAREAAKVRLGQVAKGINPRTERLRLKAENDRDRAGASLGFEALGDECGEPHIAHRRQRYREEGAASDRTHLRGSFETSSCTCAPRRHHQRARQVGQKQEGRDRGPFVCVCARRFQLGCQALVGPPSQHLPQSAIGC